MHVYETKHVIAHTSEQMFALVADIESYPKFLPLCEQLTIRRREKRGDKEALIATIAVGYRMIRESFTTEVVLDPQARRIDVHYLDGPFSFLENRWVFLPVGSESCEIDFFIRYSFRSRFLERMMGGLFAKAVRHYTAAFEARADDLYGTAQGAALSQQA
jgi:coenzyme Q-binding protein COQ10